MYITFSTKKLNKLCSDPGLRTRKWGSVSSKKIQMHLDNLAAAQNLSVMRALPGRCHELFGDREGQLSLDLKHPLRLIFEPANNPVPRREDGSLDWCNVTAVKILEVKDYHGKQTSK